MSEVTAVPLRPIAKGSLVKLWAGVAIVLAAAVGAAYVGTRSQVAMAQSPEEYLAANAKRSGVVTTASGLQYEVIKKGAGPKPGLGDMVLVDYDGKLVSGESFDSSAAHGNGPAPLPVAGMIPGWTEGLQLMERGAKYRFWMPPALAYGDRGASDKIPPNAITIFDVTLHEIAPASAMGGAPM
ncbi:MAG: peptidylprolyl isomerase [Rhizorhabdus sp.]|nr:peptidylprolyl isomerase [Rhizorhabdus sp.]